MSTVQTPSVHDIGYGLEFKGWYDRLFPKDDSAARTAGHLAALHPDPAAGTVEFGVGTGRIALPLAALVGPVTGVDSSPEMLDGLRAALASRTDVEPVHGDIRTYRAERTAGLVYCVCGTLSMLLTPEEQQLAVRRAAGLLAPGGRLVVETHNRPAIHALHEGRSHATYFTPYPERGTGLQTHSTLLPENDLWHCSHIWYEADGSTRVGTELSRLTTPDEVDAYARAAGLVPESRSAGWGGEPYAERSPMFVCTYVKPGTGTASGPGASDAAAGGGEAA
ncbi:class I SAM-dependent methyltransferase [Kitasatospora sp. NPDC059722]|uniref:class I SAM-dependent methyltransferase n=1 Tax=Kitasatospora sp. NPDC059722 TaxID=3346925 RepID=UPI0036ABEA8E